MSSAEFRKTYPRLDEPVAVTALGHIIGHYVPVNAEMTAAVRDLRATLPGPHKPTIIEGVPKIIEVGGRKAQQTERDAILRKVNRGG